MSKVEKVEEEALTNWALWQRPTQEVRTTSPAAYPPHVSFPSDRIAGWTFPDEVTEITGPSFIILPSEPLSCLAVSSRLGSLHGLLWTRLKTLLLTRYVVGPTTSAGLCCPIRHSRSARRGQRPLDERDHTVDRADGREPRLGRLALERKRRRDELAYQHVCRLLPIVDFVNLTCVLMDA